MKGSGKAARILQKVHLPEDAGHLAPCQAVACFGEMLWDCLPQGLFPGGAPVNVAYHLHRLGCDAIPISAVGSDFLGEEWLRRLAAWHVPSEFVTVLPHKPTGVVRVDLDTSGSPTFDIVTGVAWDEIPAPPVDHPFWQRCRAVVFGSLAQRTQFNRSALKQILAAAPNAWRVFDVNLRAPFDDLPLVRELAAQASLIKLNHDELGRLAPGAGDSLENKARDLAAATKCPIVCVTAGAKGAGLLREGRWHWENPRPVRVADTVGAGDAFLAALLHGLLTAPEESGTALQRACRLAEYVASRPGATPA